jgi:hypothetical protein
VRADDAKSFNMKYIFKRYDYVMDAMEEAPEGEFVKWEDLQYILRMLSSGDNPKIMENGFSRRCRIDLQAPAEAAIRQAIAAVEAAGAHIHLTDAVVLLGHALDKVADYVELEKK